jgi:hypothetical protein
MSTFALTGHACARVVSSKDAPAPTSKTSPQLTQGLGLGSILALAWEAVCATGEGRAAHRQHSAAARGRH